MDQDSTGTEDDANAIKNSLYLIDDVSYYFQVGCYTVSALLMMFMLGMVNEKHSSQARQGKGEALQEGGGESLYHQSKYTGSVSDTTTDFY